MKLTPLHLKNKRKFENLIFYRIVLAIAFIEPLTTLGQIYQIWKSKSAVGNSLATWSFFAFSGVIWLSYGVKIKSKPLIVSSMLWVITESIVIVQIIHFS
jgi:uncharacterized protein with PQ loop repeat